MVFFNEIFIFFRDFFCFLNVSLLKSLIEIFDQLVKIFFKNSFNDGVFDEGQEEYIYRLVTILRKKRFNDAADYFDLFRLLNHYGKGELNDESLDNFLATSVDYTVNLKHKNSKKYLKYCSDALVDSILHKGESFTWKLAEGDIYFTFDSVAKITAKYCQLYCISKTDTIVIELTQVYSIDSLRKFKARFFLHSLNIKFKINEDLKVTLLPALYGFSKLSSEDLIKDAEEQIQKLTNEFTSKVDATYSVKEVEIMWVAKHLFKKKLSYIGFGGNGNQIRDVIHVDDVCKIIFIQIINFNKKFNNTFNIGGGLKNAISLKELTSKCEKLSGNKLKIRKLKKTSMFDMSKFLTDNKKINKFYDIGANFLI